MSSIDQDEVRPAESTMALDARDAKASALGVFLQNRFVSILVLWIAAIVYFSLAADSFMTVNNVRALLGAAAVVWVVALGTTFVMILGNFDLSVGSMLTLSGVLVGWFVVTGGMPIWLACVVTLIVGAGLGAFLNGMLVGRFGVSFLVVTLGTSWLFLGLVNLVSDTRTVPLSDAFFTQLAFGLVGGVPVSFIVMIVTLAVAHFVLTRTLFGRDVFAVGGSPVAARLSGIRASRTIVIVYGISASAAVIGGILQASRISAGSPLVGSSILFDAVAAVLLGGTSFRGGSGSVIGTAIGVLFLATLANGLGFLGVPSYWQQVLTGLIVVLAGIAEKLQRDGTVRRRSKSPS